MHIRSLIFLSAALLAANGMALAVTTADADSRAPSESTEATAFDVTLKSQPEVRWNGEAGFVVQVPARAVLKLKQRTAGGASWVQGRLIVNAPGSPDASFTIHTVKLLPQPATDAPPTATPLPLHPVGAKLETQDLVNRTGDAKSKEYILYGKGDVVEFGCEVRLNEYCVGKDGNEKVLFKVRRVQ